MHMPLGKVKTICDWTSGSGCFEVASILTLGLTKGDNSTNAGELLKDFRLLYTQYSNALLENPIDAANSRSVCPLFFHSSTLANIAADFGVFMIP
jgi:hypothetical protein